MEERNISLEFVRSTVGAGFLCPVYHIVRVLPAVPPTTAGLWTVSSVSLPTLSKNNQKQVNALAVLGLAFFFVFDFASRRRTLNLEDALPLRALPAGVCVTYALHCEVYNCGPSLVWSCMLQRCHARLRLSSPLVSAVSWLRPRPILSQHGHRLRNSRLSVALARPRTRQASLGSSTPYCVIASQPASQLLDDIQALLLCPVSSSC